MAILGSLADLHLRDFDLLDKLKVLDAALESMLEHGVDEVLVAGDVLENGRVITGRRWSAPQVIAALLERVDRFPFRWRIVAGNHDIDGLKPHGLDLLRSHPRVTVVDWKDGPQLITVHEMDDYREVAYDLLMIPWVDFHHLYNEMEETVPTRDELVERWFAQIEKAVRDIPGPEEYPRDRLPLVALAHVELAEIAKKADQPGYPVPTLADLEVRAKSPDVWLLGHYHTRTEFPGDSAWYLGALCRQNFGEGPNPTGWAKVDLQEGTVEFIEVNAPRWFTLYDDYQDFHQLDLQPWDHLRLVGPDPQGQSRIADHIECHAEYIKQPDATFTRGRDLPEDMSTLGLLRAWAEEQNVPLPEGIEEKVAEISSQEPTGGRLEAVHSITLQNIGPWAADGMGVWTSNRIEFGGQHTAIMGPVGVGKTILLESLLAAAWGRWVHRGSFQQLATETPALIAIDFAADGERYTLTRKMEGKAFAELLKWTGKWEPVASGVDRTEAAITEILGDRDTFRATSFVDQRALDSVLTATDAKRMSAMRSFLGLQAMDRFKDVAGKKSRGLDAVRARLAENEKEDAAILQQYAEASDRRDVLKAGESQQLALLKAAQEEATLYTSSAKRINEIAFELQRLSHAKAELAKINPAELLQRAQERLAEMEAAKPLAMQLTALKERYTSLQARVRQDGVLRDSIARNSKLAMVLDQVGCRENLLPCPLITQAVEAKEEIGFLQERLQLEGLQAGDGPAELEQLKQEVNRAEHAAQTALRLPQQLKDVQELAGTEERIRGRMAEHLAQEQALQKELPGLQAYVSQFEGAAVRAEQLQQQKEAADRELYHLERCLHELQERAYKVGALITERQAEVKDMELWDILARAFAREGIPQYLIAHALPMIQARLDELTMQYYEGRFRLILGTLKESGGETFSITFECARGSWPVESCSGGELSMCRVVWQAALLHYLKSRRQGSKVLFLDEPTAHTTGDEFVTGAMIDMLAGLQEHFQQVVMVTHSAELAAHFSQVIDLGK